MRVPLGLFIPGWSPYPPNYNPYPDSPVFRPRKPNPKPTSPVTNPNPADLNRDGKVDGWDWTLWFSMRRFWDLMTPPFTIYPPGFGDEGPGTNDPRLDPCKKDGI